MENTTKALLFLLGVFLIGCVLGAGVCGLIMHNSYDQRMGDTHDVVLGIFDDTRAKIGSSVNYAHYQTVISPILSDARVKLDNVFTTGILVIPAEPAIRA